MNRLQVLIPEGLDARIRKAASRRRISKGEWVRRAIQKSLESGGPDTDPLSELARLNAPTADIDDMLAEIEAGRS